MTEQKKLAAQEAAPVHANVYVALAAAQSEMGALIKGEVNPHFRSKYADLADVVAACREPFTRNGLCFYHHTGQGDDGWQMVTTLVHGASGSEISCAIPLIVQKNDMQGFKSATTYAKRIGLESVSGLAPEDDDGNDAAKAAPQCEPPAVQVRRREMASREAVSIAIESLGNAETLDALKSVWTGLSRDVQHDAEAIAAKNKRKAELDKQPAPQHEPINDEIPEFG